MTFKTSYSKGFNGIPFVEKTIQLYRDDTTHFELESSGSTGAPKLIELSRKLLKWSARQTVKALDLSHESVLCALPITKTGGFMQLFRSMENNWHIHFVDPSSDPFERIADDHSFTLTSLSPQQLNHAIINSPQKLARFKNVLIGGARIIMALEATLNEFIAKNPNTQFYETYGMTETASHVALRNINKKEAYLKPQDGVIISLEQSQIKIQIPEFGIILLTNDIGIIGTKGFKVIGRIDNVINSGGIKIHPENIELSIYNILNGAGISRPFYVAKKFDSELGEKAVLVIEGEPIQDESFILELIKRGLPDHHHPREIIYQTRLDKTDTGKIIRNTF